jgi:hypothetical protein
MGTDLTNGSSVASKWAVAEVRAERTSLVTASVPATGRGGRGKGRDGGRDGKKGGGEGWGEGWEEGVGEG